VLQGKRKGNAARGARIGYTGKIDMSFRRIGGWMAAAMAVAPALAAAQQPQPKGMSLQEPATPVMQDLVWLDNMLLYIITAITVLVLALLLVVIVRFNAKANPTPARFTHNAPLEVLWTAIPVVILVIIAIPSLRLLDKQITIPEPELTIKATGYQWYWGYQYPDEGIEFTSNMVGLYAETEEERNAALEEAGYAPTEYLLGTDNRMVVPVDTTVELLVTGADSIHAWAMPAFGIKTDAIPGRINSTWFNVQEEGTYFGQCSQICGVLHAYMPITVEAVSQEEFEAWVSRQTAASGQTDLAAK
jgi:cytochrome c oxidase subunit 2